jgi:hypothetical protein
VVFSNRCLFFLAKTFGIVAADREECSKNSAPTSSGLPHKQGDVAGMAGAFS